MHLYTYFRSSAAFRVRIALNIKGQDYQSIAINLVSQQHKSPEYSNINTQGLVPSLELDNGEIITQSGAIIEWLEESYPTPALLPNDALLRAKCRSLCNIVGCDIHPINNLRVLTYLKSTLDASEQETKTWYQHWIKEGFNAIEPALAGTPFAMGKQLSMVDVYLVPQVFNALRFDLDMTPYPKIMSVYQTCMLLDVFSLAAPSQQPDAV